MKIFPGDPSTFIGPITTLSENQVFVFGSNTEGRHGKGAALFARMNCGAVYGQAEGLQGKSYAIVTKNLKAAFHPSVSTKDITLSIFNLYKFAAANTHKTFLVAYAKGTLPLNGYTIEQLAEMFFAFMPPVNVAFESGFSKLKPKKQ